jgi:putative membrane protein
MRRPSYNPYSKFDGRSLSLNDYLAIDRTILANERTLLSYGRTALAMVIIGGSCLKFFDSPVLAVIGWSFLAGAAITMLLGWRRYRHTDRLLRAALVRKTGEEEHPLEDASTDKPVKEARRSGSGEAPPARQ